MVKALKNPCVPSKTVLGPKKSDLPNNAACIPELAAQPGCILLVHVPSAKYSIMPEAILPATPKAEDNCFEFNPRTTPNPAAAPNTLQIAVGWKPCLCIAVGETNAILQINSAPIAIPLKICSPFNLKN